MDEMTLEQLWDYVDSHETALKIDGFDDCIVGTGEVAGSRVIIYSEEAILEKLCGDMSTPDALEHYSFNIACAYLGQGTPVIMDVKRVGHWHTSMVVSHHKCVI